jgi:hypothetical protein
MNAAMGDTNYMGTNDRKRLSDIRRLWKSIGGDDPLPAPESQELATYFKTTLLRLLCELDDLARLAAQTDSEEFSNRFVEARRLMSRELQLVMEIGMVIFRNPKSEISQ